MKDAEMVKGWIKKLENDSDMVKILFDGIKGLPGRIEAIGRAFKDGDKTKLKFLVHELKGLSGNLGMDEIYSLTLGLENEINNVKYDEEKIRESFLKLNNLVYSIPGGYFNDDSDVRQTEYEKNKENFKILVAEDNEINQRLIAKLLERQGLSCDTADNGKSAWELIKKRHYDLVLLDIQMPEMDGIEVIKRIVKNKELKGLHVIALTAAALKGNSEEYRVMGFNDYLSKPIDFELFNEKIRNLILKKQEEAGGKAGPELTEDAAEEFKSILKIFEENVSLFNPKRIKQAANMLKKLSDHNKVRKIHETAFSAADHFDENALKFAIAELKEIIANAG
ncbi:MAG: response regulator [Spirochaetes bacterium]|nr:response regulator [Spirochaetota bacterium]